MRRLQVEVIRIMHLHRVNGASIGRAHVLTPVTYLIFLCRLQLEKKNMLLIV